MGAFGFVCWQLFKFGSTWIKEPLRLSAFKFCHWSIIQRTCQQNIYYFLPTHVQWRRTLKTVKCWGINYATRKGFWLTRRWTVWCLRCGPFEFSNHYFFLLGSKSIIKFKGEPYSPPRVCSRSKVAYWRNYENMSEHFQQWLVYLSLSTFPKTKRTKTKQRTRTKIQTSPWALNSSGKYEFTTGSHFKINSGYAQHKTTVAEGRNPGQWGPVEGTRRALLDKKKDITI